MSSGRFGKGTASRAALLASVGLMGVAFARPATAGLEIDVIGRYASGVFNGAAAEISAFDPGTRRLFVVDGLNPETDGDTAEIRVLDLSSPTNPVPIGSIDTDDLGISPNSVAVHNGVVAVALEADPITEPGMVAFFDASTLLPLSSVEVGPVPDMLTFTPFGAFVLVANEGLPNADYTIDPEGSISIINMTAGAANVIQADVRTADFTAFNGQEAQLRATGVRIYGPGASVAQDLEPEYIDIAPLSPFAYVSLQENNALAKVNILTAEVEEIIGLGFKDHSVPGNGLDASDEDGGINIEPWPVLGIYQPDGVAVYRTGIPLRTYVITADEGDDREYEGNPGFVELERIGDLTLDLDAFPDAAFLQLEENLGRLEVTTADGDTDNDADFDQLFVPGARSFSIWTDDGIQVFNSGDQIEQITAVAFPNDFNSTRDESPSFDTRSDARGAEPSNVTIGRIGLRSYGFFTLERMGGVIVYDVTRPNQPRFCDYVNNRDFTAVFNPDDRIISGDPKDLGPEGVIFIPWYESPNLRPLLVVSNELSGSVTIYRVRNTRGQCGGFQVAGG